MKQPKFSRTREVKCARPAGDGPDSEQNDFPFKISSQCALHKKAAAGSSQREYKRPQPNTCRETSHITADALLVRKLNNDRARSHICNFVDSPHYACYYACGFVLDAFAKSHDDIDIGKRLIITLNLRPCEIQSFCLGNDCPLWFPQSINYINEVLSFQSLGCLIRLFMDC